MADTNLKECMITTIDNPYDYFTDFVNWFMFDTEKGYNTCSYLARLAEVTDSMSQPEINKEIERCVDDMIKYDFMNIYKKIYK